MKCLIVVFLALLSLGCCQSNLNAYPFSAVLRTDGNGDPLYTLHWNFSATEETITFGVNVSTNGWVGFGISPNGGMANSDVVIGWVNDNGEVFFHDRFAFGQSRPPVDPQQDWTLIRGESANGYTVLEFWRKWVTCDERDRDILADTSHVVYAWNDNDPENDDADDGPMYHGAGNRGAAPLNLLSGVTNPINVEAGQGSIRSFTLAVENVAIPDDDTTYWCAALELPQEIQQQKQYIIKYSPRITPNEFQYVHHMLIYLCSGFNETQVGESAPCVGTTGASVSECRQGSLIAGWAVGGADFTYPDNVAYPLGGEGNPRFVVIEMHYDNPNLRSGVMDSSGIEFFYTSQPRQHEAGILNLGHNVSKFMVIPPRTDRYDIIGMCAPECTSQYLPPDGIKIFGNLLHTHLVGRGLTLRLIRNTDECGGLQELRPIDQNLQYDFNFQQFTILPDEITVLPGDTLLLECNYNTSENADVVLGGEATREEMCLSFAVYYPRIPLFLCSSSPGRMAFNQLFQFISPENINPLWEEWLNGSTARAEAALNRYVNWTPAAAAAIQESVLNGDLYAFCATTENDFVGNFIESLPDVKCPYVAPQQCPTAAGAAALIGNVVTTVGLIILAVLLL